jgi:hypothetical protein
MREPLYRKQFGLKPRSIDELIPKSVTKGTKWEDYDDAPIYLTNPDGTLRFNPESELGQAALQEVARPAAISKSGASGPRHRALGGYLRAPLLKGAEYDPTIQGASSYQKRYGKAILSDRGQDELSDKLLTAIHGPNYRKLKGWASQETFQEGAQVETEIDRIFYNDVWDFKLNKEEAKNVKGYIDEIKSILTDKMPTVGFEHHRPISRQVSFKDPKLSTTERLKILKHFLTDPEMEEYHGGKATQFMRQFMNKIIDHVEVKGIAKFEEGRKGHIGRKLVNVEDEDLIWRELVGDYLK